GQMVFSVLAAYAFSHLRFPGRHMLFWVYVATLMVPQVVVVVALYLMMSEVGLRNTFWALVLPFVLGSPYAIFLLRENFRSVPAELMDAMRIDGAGTLRLLWHLVVPLNRPIIVTLVLITVVTHWNNFLWPMVITSGPECRAPRPSPHASLGMPLVSARLPGTWRGAVAAQGGGGAPGRPYRRKPGFRAGIATTVQSPPATPPGPRHGAPPRFPAPPPL